MALAKKGSVQTIVLPMFGPPRRPGIKQSVHSTSLIHIAPSCLEFKGKIDVFVSYLLQDD